MNISNITINSSTHLLMVEFKELTLKKMSNHQGWSWNSYSEAMGIYVQARQAGDDESQSFRTASAESVQSLIMG